MSGIAKFFHKKSLVKVLVLLGSGALLSVATIIFASVNNALDTPQAPSPARPIKTMVLTANGAPDSEAFPGTVRAVRRVDLAFRVPGELLKFPVQKGQQVRKGELIARLDPRDFELAVQTLAAQLHGAEATLTEAQLNFQRQKELFARDMTAKVSLDQATAAFELAEADRSRIEHQLAQATANLADTRLTAPFSGTIGDKMAENFENVQAGQSIVKLQDLSSLEIVVHVPENLIANSRMGDNATAVFEAFPGKRFSLLVKEIGTDAEPGTRTFPVTLVMPRPKGVTVLPGMTAEVSRPLTSDKTALSIPVEAAFADGQGRQCVWVVDRANMTVHRSPIETGPVSGDRITVFKGLSPGDMIVTSGVHFLTPGTKVRPM